MQKVFVIDATKQPLAPCSPARARVLLTKGKASVFCRFPFTIILKRTISAPPSQPLRLKIDPGSKVTGLAIVNDQTGEVIFAAEIEHRGDKIKSALNSRRAIRRNRRNRKTRYRPARFLNRARRGDWLPPSLESRIANITTWVKRLRRYCPVSAISQELVRFDTQLMQKVEISGLQYQRGELAGYELREYVLVKFNHQCVYCKAKNTQLQLEHIVPRSRGGSDRVSNLTLACQACNQRKGNRTAEEFGYPNVQALAKAPLKDAAAVNATRWELLRRLQSMALPIETSSGGLTKFNRSKRGLPKSHWLDATCVGESTPAELKISKLQPLTIKATGHGTRQRCRPNTYGFAVGHAPRAKYFQGFQTGDIARAVIPKGKYAGCYTGRVAIRFRPSFRLYGFDVHPKYLRLIHKADGYETLFFKAALPLQLTAKAV